MSKTKKFRDQVSFFFEGGPVGKFIGEPPTQNGLIGYMPFRSYSHQAMHTAIRENGYADCHYEMDGRSIRFRVVACPEYGRLQVADLPLDNG